MTDAIGPATDRFLLAVVAIVVLVVTVPFLPSAVVDGTAPAAVETEGDAVGSGPDPAEDGGASGGGGSEFVAGDSGSESEEADVEIAVDASNTSGYLVPSYDVLVTVTQGDDDVSDAEVFLDGEAVGTTDDDGEYRATVPGTEELTIEATVPSGATGERTLDVEDDVSLSFDRIDRGDSAAIDVLVDTPVGAYPLDDADVLVDGDRASVTDEGDATVDVPGEADGFDLAVEYGDLRTTRSFEYDLSADVETLLPVAGSTVDVSASYDDVPASVDVYVVRGDVRDRAPTVVDEHDPVVEGATGTASDWLPAASSATVVVTDGYDHTTVTLQGLLRNLGIGVVLALSFVGGVTVTTMRTLRWLETLEGNAGPTRQWNVLAAFGTALVSIGAGLAAVVGSVSVPRLPRPSLSAPRLPAVGLPSLPTLPDLSLSGAAFPSLRLGSLSLPSLSLPSFGGVGVPDVGRPSLDSEDGEDDGPAGPVDPFVEPEEGDDVPQLSKRELVRAAIRDLGRLADVRSVETSTPGQIGRRAVDAALPREPVEAIVGTVRTVEYGGEDPTDEDASRVRRAVRSLRDALEDGVDEGVDDGGEHA